MRVGVVGAGAVGSACEAAPEAVVLVVTDPPDALADVVRMLGHERVVSKAARNVKGNQRGHLLNKSYDEVHVFGGVAERTGNQFDPAGVHGRRTTCRSVTDLGAKVRRLGDGYYDLATGVWPDCLDRVDLNRLGRRWDEPGAAEGDSCRKSMTF